MKASWRLVLGAGYLKVVGYSLRKIVPFFFFLTFFFFFKCVGACLGDLKISRLVYLCKACLRLEYLGKESDSMLSEFLKGQKKIGDC